MLILLPSSDVNVSSSLRTWAWLSLPWISPQSQLIYPKYIPSLGKNFLSWKTRASTPTVYCLSPSLHSAWQYEIVSFVSSFDLRLSAMFSSVQSLSRVRLFVTPWITARQASLSITNSGVHPNPCPLSRWCHPTISSSVVPFSSCPQSFPASESFQMSQLFASGGQCWSFSFNISPSNEHQGLVLSPCNPRDSQESSPTPQFKSINSLALSFLHSPTLTSIHDHWKNHGLD